MQTDHSNRYFELASRYVQHTGRHIFLTGKAGTGKTTFLKYIREHCSKKMAVVAPTGVAAINAGGVTVHTFFQLPLGAFVPTGQIPESGDQLFNNRQTLLRNLRLSQPKRILMRELELLVVDEVSMLRADMLDAMDVVLRHVRRKPSLPFGGVQVLFIGDLFQLPPVVSDREWNFLKEHYKSPFFFEAHVLKQAAPVFLELKKIYRQNEETFINLLNKVRNNQMEAADLEALNRHYQPDFQPDNSAQFITLTTHNSRADNINQKALERLPAPAFRFPAEISGDFSEKAFPADEELVLKEGAQVMFIKNDKGEERRYYNGRIGTVHSITEEAIMISFVDQEELLELEKETWRNIRYQYNRAKDKIEEEELGTFSQYPIRLAWAITIHKSQGLTFDKAIIDAGAAFAPGQVYVALSRLTNMDGLVLKSRIGSAAIQTDQRVHFFASDEKPFELLEEELALAEQDFIGTSLLQSFNLDPLMELAEQWLLESDKRNIGAKLEAMEWARTFRDKVAGLIPVAIKTTAHLAAQLQQVESNGYDYLDSRTAAAANYFATAIEGFLVSLQAHKEEMRKQPRVTKYLRELAEIESFLELRLASIRRSSHLTSAMASGAAASRLLEMITEKPTAAVKDIPASEGDAQSAKDKEPGKDAAKKGHRTKGEPRVKGESQRTSLEFYRQGKSIEAIALERNLAVSTIMSHLIQFVGNGDLALIDLVPAEKVTVIRKAIVETGSEQLGPVKEFLGEGYSFDEIRAVVAYLRYHRDLKEKAGEASLSSSASS
ncbi:helix-turn-helix domain-containing protein [Flavihumibacter stibioxidans]|uniref:AAA+ ATPase domain-containing protein n=1 Tax=Flavihumibacter stibioxidans TaxID=1834163 RepID=A0ABR7MD76_9BACT|nr:helix-turn-helix domain-containing protein [Flavihumibacter stibioxidans]MBC6492779.1 hypothetical protein [Flavihumibacter stibioxidans]